MSRRRRRTRFKPRLQQGGSVRLQVPLPVSVRLPRTVNYTYPKQQQRRTKTIRTTLTERRRRYRMVMVKVKVPRTYPYLQPSYVSIDRGRINIHGKRRTEKLLAKEANRRRYNEHKTRRRKARHGQLESLRNDPYGIVAESVRRGHSIRQIADAALYSRSIT